MPIPLACHLKENGERVSLVVRPGKQPSLPLAISDESSARKLTLESVGTCFVQQLPKDIHFLEIPIAIVCSP